MSYVIAILLLLYVALMLVGHLLKKDFERMEIDDKKNEDYHD